MSLNLPGNDRYDKTRRRVRARRARAKKKKKQKMKNAAKKKQPPRVNPHGYFGEDTGFGSATRTAFNCSIGFSGTPGAAAAYPRQVPSPTKFSKQINWKDSLSGSSRSMGLSRDATFTQGIYAQQLSESDPGAFSGHRNALRPHSVSRLRTAPSHGFTRGPRRKIKIIEGASPASFDVNINYTRKNTAHASFSGHKERKNGEIKRPTKIGDLHLRKDFIYREVALNRNSVVAAPGAHKVPGACGEQVESHRKFPSGHSFGCSHRKGPETMGNTHESLRFAYLNTDISGPGYDAPRPTTGNVKTSSFKKQYLSKRRSSPSAGFGTASRFEKAHAYKWHTKLNMSW